MRVYERRLATPADDLTARRSDWAALADVHEALAGNPDSVKIEAGTMFECTVALGTPKATVVMSQDDDQGNVTINSITGILIAPKLERAISDDCGRKLNVHITTSCGDRVRTATAGDKFTCDARDAKGNGGKVMVTVKDPTGNVSFELVGRREGHRQAEAQGRRL